MGITLVQQIIVVRNAHGGKCYPGPVGQGGNPDFDFTNLKAELLKTRKLTSLEINNKINRIYII